MVSCVLCCFFSGMKNSRVIESQKFLLRFKKKAWEAKKKSVTESQFLQRAHETAVHAAVRVKPKLLWRLQEI